MASTDFDVSRAWLRGPDYFPRFVVEEEGTALSHAGLKADDELIVVEYEGEAMAFLSRELSHPHMAQGKLAGHPYLVSF